MCTSPETSGPNSIKFGMCVKCRVSVSPDYFFQFAIFYSYGVYFPKSLKTNYTGLHKNGSNDFLLNCRVFIYSQSFSYDIGENRVSKNSTF